MENKEIVDRLDLLRKKLLFEKIDFYYIPTSDYHHSEYIHDYFKIREYFSGFTGSSGELLISQKECILWTDGRYFVQAKQELEGSGILLFRSGQKGVLSFSEYLSAHLKPQNTVGFDGRLVDADFGKRLVKLCKKKNCNVNYSTDIVELIWQDRPSIQSAPIMVLSKELAGMGVDKKFALMRKQMKKKKASSIFLNKLDDIMWLMNIRGFDVPHNMVAFSYCILTQYSAILFIKKAAISEELAEHCAKYEILLQEYEEKDEFLQREDIVGDTLWIDAAYVTYFDYKMVSGQTKVIKENNPTELYKAIKNKTEIKHLRKVYLQDSVIVTKFIYWIKKHCRDSGMDEVTAGEYLDTLRRQSKGFLDYSFTTICAYQENAAQMHYSAKAKTCKQIKKEGLLLVDSGGQYKGGTTDVTRTIVLGKLPRSCKENYTKTVEGLLQLSNATFMHGCTGRNLDILAREPLWEVGIDYKCGTGHGIGYMLGVHEGPQGIRSIYRKGTKEAVLEEGMLVSVEPGVYIEGAYGIRIENICLCKKKEETADGEFMQFETLTFAPIDLAAIDKDKMDYKNRKLLNDYHKQVYDKIAPFLNKKEKSWLKEQTKSIN